MTDIPGQPIEVVQSVSPIIVQPEILTTDAMAPIDLMTQLNAAATQINDAPRRGRGRPRGSKNRTTLEREQQTQVIRNQPSRIVPPPSRHRIPTDDKPLTDEERLAEAIRLKATKEARADQIAVSIATELNDNIMLALVSIGIPANLLYKPGQVPKTVEEASKYTEWAGNVVISPHQARTYGRFAAEIEATNTGRNLVTKTGASKAGLYWFGILSLGATVQYVQGLSKFVEQMKPIMEEYKARQDIAANHQQQYEPPTEQGYKA